MLKSPSFPSEPCHLHTSTVLDRGIYQHSPNRAYTSVNRNEGIPEGKATFFPNYYVGNSLMTREACEQHLEGLHNLFWRRVVVNKIPYLVLRVQLFSLLAAPAYD